MRRRVLALQARQPASPYVALWNRLAGFDPADVDAAFRDGGLVRATLTRIALHAVHAEDCRVPREAMRRTLHASRLGFRFAATGLSLTPEDAGRLVPDGALWGLRAGRDPRVYSRYRHWWTKISGSRVRILAAG